jgi:ferritin-like metal-binding protein YciE
MRGERLAGLDNITMFTLPQTLKDGHRSLDYGECQNFFDGICHTEQGFRTQFVPWRDVALRFVKLEQVFVSPVLKEVILTGRIPMTKEKELKDLFLDTLKDIYFAEKQILKALPKMAKAAQSDKLRAAFEKHHDETEGQVERLEQVFELINAPARGKTCDAIQGILDEGKEIMDEYKGMPALDAGLLAAAQAVEHYEISRYGSLKTWATELGYKDAVNLLDATLNEEKNTDSALSQLAKSEVNHHAETAKAA